MTTTFIALPCPAANGVGASTDLSTMGKTKTFVVSGIAPGDATVNIEVNLADDPTTGSWAAVYRAQGGGTKTIQIAGKWFRARTSSYRRGTPAVNVGSNDSGTTSVDLPPPPDAGSGAAVDVSALPRFKTVQVSGAFTGPIQIEVSTDGTSEWGVVASFPNQGGQTSFVSEANHARVTRMGAVTGSPVITLAGADDASSSGGSAGSGNHFAMASVQNSEGPLYGASQNFTPTITFADGVTTMHLTEGVPDQFSVVVTATLYSQSGALTISASMVDAATVSVEINDVSTGPPTQVFAAYYLTVDIIPAP